MSETRTLWQRCEALGQFEDFKDEHVEMLFASGRWVIRHDGQCILFIYEDKVRGSEWLADAILFHIERMRFPMPEIKPLEEMSDDEKAAFMKAMNEWTRGPITWMPNESVVTMQNINEKVREALPKPVQEPTPDQFRAFFRWIVEAWDDLQSRGFRVTGQEEKGWLQVVETRGKRRSFSLTVRSFSNDALPFDQACEMVGYNPMPVPVKLPDVTYVVEAPKPTEPTQEQLKAIWDHVTHLTGEQSEYFGFQYSVIANGPLAQFELHIKSPNGCVDQWQIKIMHGHIGRYWWENPFDLVTTVQLLRMEMTIPTEQYVFESPEQFVSIPTEQWTELQTAFKAIAKVLCFEIKDVDYED